ncbi:hypothetical protein [Thermococcus sp.]
MARIVRIISAIILLVLLVQYPIVTIEPKGLPVDEVELTYPVLALIATGGIISEMFYEGISAGWSKFLENEGNLLEEISQIRDQGRFTELNILAFILLLALAVFVVPTIGVFMAFFTRWGFVLVAIGMGIISAAIFANGNHDWITITPYFYGIWGLIILGIIAGGSGKKKKEVSK